MMLSKLKCGVGKKINTIAMKFMEGCLPITTNAMLYDIKVTK